MKIRNFVVVLAYKLECIPAIGREMPGIESDAHIWRPLQGVQQIISKNHAVGVWVERCILAVGGQIYLMFIGEGRCAPYGRR